MADVMSVASLEKAFKIQYADNMPSLIPEMAPLLSKATYKVDKKMGKNYTQPVVLSYDQGFTCFGDNDQNLDFNEPIAHAISEATVKSTAYGARSWITNTALKRAASSEQAFITNTSYYVQSLVKSFSHMLEGENWYGRAGLATGTVSGVSGSVLYINVTAKEAAPFLFLGGEGMVVEAYIWAGGTTPPTDSASADATIKITNLDMASSNANGANTQDGGITIKAELVSGALTNADKVDIYRKGYKKNPVAAGSHAGLKKILTATEIFGIDSSAANNSLWKPNNVDAANQALTYSLISKYIAQTLAKGLTGPLKAYLRSVAFRQLFPDVDSIGTQVAQAAQDKARARKINSKEEAKSFAHGTKTVELVVDSVDISFESTEFVKGGDCFFIDPTAFCLVGSAKPEFGSPGASEGFLIPVQGKNVYEMRMFSDISPFVEARNKHLLLTNIAV